MRPAIGVADPKPNPRPLSLWPNRRHTADIPVLFRGVAALREKNVRVRELDDRTERDRLVRCPI
jgi:hypothetical protein